MDETSEDDRGSRKKRNSCSSWFAHFLFSCCCAGFLNPNGEGSKEYYETLGVTKHSKLADIKKAYKKLSLSYHPDKLRQRGETLTEEMQEKFRKIKQAYEVLSDPERRKIYDSLGINGIILKEDPASFMQNPAKLQEMVNKADKRAWCVVLSITTLILGFIFLFPVLFALEVDGEINVSFTAIFTPLWAVYLIMLIVIVMEVARGRSVRPEELEEDEEWFDENPLLERQIGLLAFILFVLFQVMLVSKLDGGFDSDDSWLMVMIPYYLFEIAEMISEWMSLQTCLRSAAHTDEAAGRREAKEDGEEDMMNLSLELRLRAEESRGEARLHLSSVIYHNYRLIQVFVIVLRVDGYFGDSNWWLVLIPTMVYTLLNCGEFCRNRYKASLKSQELDELMAKPPPESLKEHKEQELLRAKADDGVDVTDIKPEDLEAALLQSGMLDGDGQVDPEVMKALVDSLRNADNNIEGESVHIMNPTAEEGNDGSIYKCPDCEEVFHGWDSCMVHFATANHTNYDEKDSLDMVALKAQCLIEDIDSAIEQNLPFVSHSEEAGNPLVSNNDQTVVVPDEEANIDDID